MICNGFRSDVHNIRYMFDKLHDATLEGTSTVRVRENGIFVCMYMRCVFIFLVSRFFPNFCDLFVVEKSYICVLNAHGTRGNLFERQISY